MQNNNGGCYFGLVKFNPEGIMLSPAVSKFLSQTAVTTAFSTSLAGIFQYEDPRATAAATITSATCREVIRQLTPNSDPYGLVTFVVSGYFGSLVGQRVNKDFSYINMAISEGVVLVGFAIFAAAVGLKPSS